MREALKKIKPLRSAVHACRSAKDSVKKCRHNVMVRVNPHKVNIELYERRFGRKPNLENPSNFNEKSMWLMHHTYYKNPVITRCVDKYGMRGYLQEKGYSDYLPEVYGKWDRVEDIDWNALPDRFVMKCNHGCEYNIICTDKSKLDIPAAEAKLRKWVKENFAYRFGETNYQFIKPCIYCEEYLDDGSGMQPVDWKFLCFNGEPKILMVCTERATGAKFMFTDLEYNNLHLTAKGHHYGGTLPPKPDTLDAMAQIARELAADFPFVRVDIYDIKGKLYIGELTFSPLGCAIDYITTDGLQMMGDWLDISKEMAAEKK